MAERYSGVRQKYRKTALARRYSTIIQVSGVFDIINTGHVHLILNAWAYASRSSPEGQRIWLVVTINSDESAKRVKGSPRPIMKLDDRVHILKMFRHVDDVQVFHEDTPEEITAAIQPDIYVKGHEWRDHELPEIAALEYDVDVYYVDTTGHEHSTDVINRILEAHKQAGSGDNNRSGGNRLG